MALSRPWDPYSAHVPNPAPLDVEPIEADIPRVSVQDFKPLPKRRGPNRKRHIPQDPQ